MTEKRTVAGLAALSVVVVLLALFVMQGRFGGSDPSGWPQAAPIRFIIPYSAGGGHDAYARRFAPVLEEILGTPVVPENVTGAGGRIGMSTIYRAEPDGYTIGIMNIPGLAVAPLLGQTVQYDIDRVSWLAQLSFDPYAIAVRPDTDIHSFEDLCSLGRPAVLAVDALGTTATITTIVAMAVADCPYKLVSGYHDSTRSTLAVMRGDVDARISPLGSMRPYAESGDVRMLMTFEERPSVPGVPAAGQLGYDAFTRFGLRRVVGGPPGMPEGVRERLSRALLEAADSPAIREWSRTSNRPIVPLDDEATAAALSESVGFYEQYVDLIRSEIRRFGG